MLAPSTSDEVTIPGYRLGVLIGWVALLLAVLFIYTDVDARIAYIAHENGWHVIAWLFSGAYPEL